jgi:hypothetical protein
MNIISDKDVNTLDQEMLIRDFWNRLSTANQITNNRERRNILYKYSFFVSARELTTLSLSSIGRVLNKDHATVLHAIKKHSANYMYDKTYRNVYDMVYSDLSGQMDKFNSHITDLVSRRIDKMDVDMFSMTMLKVYKSKLEKQQVLHAMQIESLKKERDAIRKYNKTIKKRMDWLNDECLRLKNLL